MTLDLGRVVTVTGDSHQNCGAPDYRPDLVRVEASTDGLQWTALAQTQEVTGGRMWMEAAPTEARWVRFHFEKTRTGPTDDWLFIGELEVY